MNPTQLPFDFSLPGVLLFLLLGLLVLGALAFLKSLIQRLPMTSASRHRLDRLMPVAEGLIALVYVLSAVPMVFGEQDQFAPIGLALVLLGVIWIFRFVIRDYISGIVIRAGQLCRVGDTVEVDGVRGRVTRVGSRTLTLRTDAGQEAIVGFGRATGQTLVRIPRADGAHRHAFILETNAQPADAHEVIGLLQRAALNHHFSSMAHEPIVEWLGDGRFEVTVYALTEPRAPLIEAAVRHAGPELRAKAANNQ
jgi:hypothetical protein